MIETPLETAYLDLDRQIFCTYFAIVDQYNVNSLYVHNKQYGQVFTGLDYSNGVY